MKLETYLVLNKYFLTRFGCNDFNELREKLRHVKEGHDVLGRSSFVNALIDLKPEWEEVLLRYDDDIRVYVERLRYHRRQTHLNFKYFQYLAILFTEIFLDNYYWNRELFLKELNDFLMVFNANIDQPLTFFTDDDLRKIAFWMATGSGKTLIMHVNYWQSLKYSREEWDNIILITPNEGLSRQHALEFKLSGIPFKLYDGNVDNLKTRSGEVLIIDVHKLTEEKKGRGVRVDVAFFDGRNLVFIDEGHKGQKSEEQRWKKLREELGKKGFLFEYSATFGQVIGKNMELLEEYAKSIIIDYSYKYFYIDGHGKDFHVFNIKEGILTESQSDMLLTASLLAFHEQLLIFERYKRQLQEYHIEKPLWVFIGSKVTGRGINSDVMKIIHFLNKVLGDEEYLKNLVKQVIKGESGFVDENKDDIFKGMFEYVKTNDLDNLIEDIYRNVFNGRGKLSLYEIKGAEGEIGLKTSDGNDYFGVINIGDARTLRKLAAKFNIKMQEDHFSSSLFSKINERDSHVNLLIGSKKFIEGWNSWRVSTMGLINMGKGEGPQIIQLFGRGVRLKGKNLSLKRESSPSYELKSLQTLFIFGLNANYINAFLTALEKEDVTLEHIKTVTTSFQSLKTWKKDHHPQFKKRGKNTFLERPIFLRVDEQLLRTVTVDLRPTVTMARGLSVKTVMTSNDTPVKIPKSYLELIDWNSIHLQVLEFKITNGMFNIIIKKDVLRQLLMSGGYRLFLNPSETMTIEERDGVRFLQVTSFEGFRKLHDLVLMVLKTYILKFCEREKRSFNSV